LHRAYPSQNDGGQAFTLGLQISMADNLNVSVDATARADTERAEVAARAHTDAVQSAAGKATMSGEHAARIQSAGGMATMSGVHAARISSAGGKASLGKIRKNYKKPNQTAHQQAEAAKRRNYRAAKRAAEAKVRVE
jgi:hypothetical protein